MSKNVLNLMSQVYLIFNNVPILWDTSGKKYNIKKEIQTKSLFDPEFPGRDSIYFVNVEFYFFVEDHWSFTFASKNPIVNQITKGVFTINKQGVVEVIEGSPED